MGNVDTKAKEYFSDPKRFADLFNYMLYNGRQVIKPESLEERDTTEVLSVFGTNEEVLLMQKWRDLLKSVVIKTNGKVFFILAGTELQANINYAMPIKNMVYDAISYAKQVNEAAKVHREKKDLKESEEFLSGFAKTDKLIPVVTITVYLGTKEWNAPRSLFDMFGDIDEAILPFIADYNANVLIPGEIDDFQKFRTGNRQVFEILSAANNNEKVKEYLNSDEAFKNLENETVRAINIFAGINISVNKKEEVTDVCKAWIDQFNDGKNEGWNEGRNEGWNEGRNEGRNELIVQMLASGKTPEEIADFTQISLSEIEKAEAAMLQNV